MSYKWRVPFGELLFVMLNKADLSDFMFACCLMSRVLFLYRLRISISGISERFLFRQASICVCVCVSEPQVRVH